MRCTNCGFPLSPTNTSLNCPRCHSALVSGAKPEPTPPSLPTPDTCPPDRALQPQTRRRNNAGFIVAGLCVISGGLILIFVYLMASGLPSTSATGAYTGIPTATSNILASPTTATPALTAQPSPTTEAFPGQQYIDNSQLASMVNTNTAQPLQMVTKFKANQRIYVTFNIHPNGKSGAVCLLWYLNSRIVTKYPFAVSASANAGYSYAIYARAGEGYVDIYWASSTACSDKMLAGHLNFTVTS